MFWKKMSLIGQVFSKLLTPRDVLVQMNNRASFWKSFGGERVTESQKLLQYAEKNFYPTISSFWAKFSLEKVIFNQIWDFRSAW